MKWKRREWTIRGSDPTTVVEWSSDKIVVVEFQDVYGVTRRVDGERLRSSEADDAYIEVHKALEDAWNAQQRLDEFMASECHDS